MYPHKAEVSRRDRTTNSCNVPFPYFKIPTIKELLAVLERASNVKTF